MIVLVKQRSHFHRLLTQNITQTSPIIFASLWNFNKPGLHHLQFSWQCLPSSHRPVSSLRIKHSITFPDQSSKCFYNPFQKAWSGPSQQYPSPGNKFFPSLLPYGCDKISIKAQSGEKFIWLIGYSPLLQEAQAGTQDGNVEAGTEAGTVEGFCSLARFHVHTQPPFLYNPESHGKGVTTHSGLGLPQSISNPRKCPRDVFIAQTAGSHSSVEVPSFQVSLICVKLKKNVCVGIQGSY